MTTDDPRKGANRSDHNDPLPAAVAFSDRWGEPYPSHLMESWTVHLRDGLSLTPGETGQGLLDTLTAPSKATLLDLMRKQDELAARVSGSGR